MKGIFKFKSFLRLFAANCISRFGDAVDMIAFGFVIYELTGSKALLATVFIFNVLPNIIFSAFSGVLVGFLSSKKVMVLGDFFRGTIVLITALLFKFNYLTVPFILGFTFLNSTIETFVSPCKYAMTPRLIDKEYYLAVNSTFNSILTLAQLIGLGASGFFIGLIGIEGAITVDALTFICSGFIILTIKFPEEEKKVLSKNDFIASSKEGFLFIKNHQMIRNFIVSMAALNFLLTPFNALITAYVHDILKGGPEALSYLSMAMMIGSIAGGLMAGKLGEKISVVKMLAIGLSVAGVFYAALSLPGFTVLKYPVLVASLVLFAFNFCIPFAIAAIGTVLMEEIPDEMRARVGGAKNMLTLSASPLGAIIATLLVQLMSLTQLFLLAGLAFSLISILPIISYKFYSKNNMKGSLEV